jgi:MFS superfamily sulfate permease-like transporter
MAAMRKDVLPGFMVFMVALPLSLGIAKASGFPASMGVLTAIIGGLVTVWFKVSPLTIKGPAAGLITIAASAVMDFGGDTEGWRIACAAVAITGIAQLLLGAGRFGFLSDFFPHSAVHGMLAAIGLIIIAKSVPILLGDDPSLYKGEGPIELLLDIPRFVLHAHWHIAVIGILGLIIMFTLPRIKHPIARKIPSPILVLLVAVPMTSYWHFKTTEPEYSLVTIGPFWSEFGINADFGMIGTFVFWKYVFMFAFVSTLESLLTVKAVDSIDPQHRISNYNGDMIGQGAGNILSGLLGGLPMISEVVRSTTNVASGAKGKWANFFHGLFLLVCMVALIPVLEMIPNSALAALLIYAGYRLTAPKEFVQVYRIGKEQLVVFLVTIIVTLANDLILGVLAGILAKILFNLYNGAEFRTLFSTRPVGVDKDGELRLKLGPALVFTNLVGYKKRLSELELKNQLTLDFSEVKLIDHSFAMFIHHFEQEVKDAGGSVIKVGMEHLKPLSNHPFATRVSRTATTDRS